MLSQKRKIFIVMQELDPRTNKPVPGVDYRVVLTDVARNEVIRPDVNGSVLPNVIAGVDNVQGTEDAVLSFQFFPLNGTVADIQKQLATVKYNMHTTFTFPAYKTDGQGHILDVNGQPIIDSNNNQIPAVYYYKICCGIGDFQVTNNPANKDELYLQNTSIAETLHRITGLTFTAKANTIGDEFTFTDEPAPAAEEESNK